MLNGTLDDFTLADVLRLIAGARRTGGLAVARDGGAGSLYFRDGAVTRAVARYERRTGPASPDSAVEDLTFDLMRWERGEFTWEPDSPAPGGSEASVDVDGLLAEVSRRMEELAQIQTLVPSEQAVLTMAPQPPEGAVQINITPAEWRVLVLVDGHRRVADVAEAAGLDDLEAMKLLYGLAAAGLVATGAFSQEVSDMSDMTAVSAVSDAAPDEVHEAPEEPVFEEPAQEEPPPPAIEEAPVPVVTAAEEPDAFLAELSMEPASPFASIPAAPFEADGVPAVDRSTAARELAGLFDDLDPADSLAGMVAAAPRAPGRPAQPRRVEDDDQVTRGLISRLIDGVKGL